MLHYSSQMNFPETQPLKVLVVADRERRQEKEMVCIIAYIFFPAVA